MANDEVVNFDTMRDMALNTKAFYDLDDDGQRKWLKEMKERDANALEIQSKSDSGSNGTPNQKTLSQTMFQEASHQQSKKTNN